MAEIRVHAFSISLDGYGAGPDQSPENPLGVGGEELHEWMFPTRTFQQMQGKEGGTSGVDDEPTRRGFENIGAWILGRNMFAPSRDHGPTTAGRGGGATTHRTTGRSSC
jgi:dihydrofolate reductase